MEPWTFEYIDFMEQERRRQGLSREKLEELSGVNASTFIKWVRGENKPQLEPYILVMRALGYDLTLKRRKKK